MGYWANREREWIKQQAKLDLDFDKQIDNIYNNSLDKIDKDISQFYTRYASKEGISIDEAKGKVSQFDVKGFESTAKKMVDERDFSDDANERLRLYNATMRINRLEMLKAQVGIDLLAETDELSDKLRERLVTELKDERVRQAGILGETVPKMTERRMETLIDGSFHGAKFSERIWTNQDVLKNELDSILTRGLVMGMNPDQLSDRLRSLISDKVKNAGYAASRIARTESARIAETYSRNLYKSYGFHKVKWIAEPSACRFCLPRDDRIYDMDDNNAPEIPAHPNCRCSTVPVDEDENEPPTPKERETIESGIEDSQVYKLIDIKSKKQFIEEMKNIGFDDVGTRGLDMSSMNKIYNTLGDFYHSYPQMNGYIKELETYRRSKQTAVAAAALRANDLTAGRIRPTLKINTAFLDNFNEMVIRNSNDGWWSKKSDYTGVIKHEMAHFINYKRAFARNGIDVENVRRFDVKEEEKFASAMYDVRSQVIDDEVVKEAFKRANLRYDVLENHTNYISKYGQSTQAETFAEAMSDEDTNNVLSNAIKEITKEELSKIDRTTKTVER